MTDQEKNNIKQLLALLLVAEACSNEKIKNIIRRNFTFDKSIPELSKDIAKDIIESYGNEFLVN